ncbi:MAG: hypothetical protein ACRC8S_20250 [Fimbriiglobus sp.]
MSTFLILPAREVMEHHLAAFVSGWLPGVPLPMDLWQTLVNEAVGLPGEHSTHFVIHRGELPGLGSVVEDLIAGYGAEPGDEILEVTANGLRRSAVPDSVAWQ